jgi:hypothetical protein
MVQGLGFLSKKSWHTKNLVNQEKVWMAEQKREAEKVKTKELAKQIQQEREQDELDKIAGKKSSTLDRGIDWMYQHGPQHTEIAKEDAAKQQEEFLLGKDFVADGTAVGDFDNGDQTEGIHNVIAHQEQHTEQQQQQQQQVGHYEPSVKDRNESFRMRIEDPMFAVSRQQYDKEQQHEQTKALYERVVGHADDSNSGDGDDGSVHSSDDKKSKKERKRHKKKSIRDSDHHRKRKKNRHSRKRSRSPSYERHRSSIRKDRRSRSRSRSVSEDSRDCHHENNRHYRRREERHSHHKRHSREEEDYDRQSRRRREFDDSRYHKRQLDDKDDDRDSRRYRHSSPEHDRLRREKLEGDHDAKRKDESSSMKGRNKEGYGLKGSTASARNTKDLGPNQELLEKKRQAREAERHRIRETASSRRRTTGEERARALREMQEDARKRDERARHASLKRSHNEDEAPSKQGASFIADMTKRTHGITGNASTSLSERLQQNRHTNQRSHESFL